MSKACFPWRTKHFLSGQNKVTGKVNKLIFEAQHALRCFQIFIIHVNHSVVRSCNKKMAASKIVIFLLLNSFLRCFSLENRTSDFDITGNTLFQKHTVSAKFCVLGNDKTSVFLLCLTDECLQALGISDGRIDDSQLIASSVYDNDFMRFGPHRARLNTTTPGYRADPSEAFSSWMRVEIERIVVVTAIATQGYGDEETPEWVTSYMLLYSQGLDYTFFRDAVGEPQVRASSFSVNIDGKLSTRRTFSYHCFYAFYFGDLSLKCFNRLFSTPKS